MKFLLIISKNYWGADKSVDSAIKFQTIFSNYLNINSKNIYTLYNSNVTVNSIKKILYDFIFNNYSINNQNKFYIYINGHGNQISDNNNDESHPILSYESIKDNLDEIYQLPDGHIIDDEITNIFIKAIKDKINNENNTNIFKPFICLFSDHCSSGSMLDNISNNQDNVFDWISFGSSLDNQDSLMSGDGNVMTINLLNLLTKLKEQDTINKLTTLQFNELLQKEMKESFIGDLQTATLHVCNKKMLTYKLFE
jgi:hypothetical protein